MKIRVMGTREECEQAQRFYTALANGDNVISSSVSGLYPNLCPTNVIEPQHTFNTFPQFKNSFGKYRQKNRSKTFVEVAEAMALSWG